MDILSFFIDWRSNLSKLSVGHTFIRGRSHLYFHQLGSKKQHLRHTAFIPLGIMLFWFLLFKIMFLSGIVKLLSQDISWWNGTALDFHYFTQPLPNPISWYILITNGNPINHKKSNSPVIILG